MPRISSSPFQERTANLPKVYRWPLFNIVVEAYCTTPLQPIPLQNELASTTRQRDLGLVVHTLGRSLEFVTTPYPDDADTSSTRRYVHHVRRDKRDGNKQTQEKKVSHHGADIIKPVRMDERVPEYTKEMGKTEAAAFPNASRDAGGCVAGPMIAKNAQQSTDLTKLHQRPAPILRK